MGGIYGIHWKTKHGFKNLRIANMVLRVLCEKYSNTGFKLIVEDNLTFIVSERKLPKGICLQCTAFMDGFWTHDVIMAESSGWHKNDPTCV